ncbi:MAG: WecB/TagA/CpsF family glycosyltransferase [Fibrobacteraceae bacterium]
MTQILNINILDISQEELLQKMSKGVLITPNLDHLIKLQKDKDFYDCYQKADWVVCDSKILFWLSKLLKNPIPEAIPGSSFFTAFYKYHKNDEKCKIFILGASEGVAQKAMDCINGRVGRKMVVGAHSPSFGFEKNEEECKSLVKLVNESGANVLIVGVGAPKQEKWITQYRSEMPGVDLFMALGATIDFEAGNLRRAPKCLQAMCLEWLYRAIKEPRRLFRRYFIEDMQFFKYFFLQQIGKYKNPFEKNDDSAS